MARGPDSVARRMRVTRRTTAIRKEVYLHYTLVIQRAPEYDAVLDVERFPD